jgi:hypothetical protein
MCMTSVFPWVLSSGLACALVLGGLNPVAGQTAKRSSSSQEVRRLSLVIGGGVRIADGVSVGKIEDVVLNDRGCIDYVVVVYHDKYVAIPWSVATVDYGERIVTVDITEQRFAEVPTFTRTEFSVLTTSEFTQKVHSAFGGKGESTSSKAGAKAESPKAGAEAESPKAGAKAKSPKAGAKAESPKGEPKSTKSEPKREPPKAAAQKNPNGEFKEPKGESKDTPKGESKEKRKGESKDKPKR